ncbi:hypothetical protein BGZ63DRAFT_154429 [Mariannaea sp. PMI_226]|nr:hypothetical protein BGZ63DRAFT_154429 [Mariannaea sp. PMI_226]
MRESQASNHKQWSNFVYIFLVIIAPNHFMVQDNIYNMSLAIFFLQRVLVVLGDYLALSQWTGLSIVGLRSVAILSDKMSALSHSVIRNTLAPSRQRLLPDTYEVISWTLIILPRLVRWRTWTS